MPSAIIASLRSALYAVSLAALAMIIHAPAANANIFRDLANRWAELNANTATPVTSPAAKSEPVVARCLIGKPSYCFKYGGTLCEKGNSKKNAKAACARWAEGCLACHNAVPTCLNNNRTNVPQSKCDRCRSTWNSCMATNDRRHWPNRMKGR